MKQPSAIVTLNLLLLFLVPRFLSAESIYVDILNRDVGGPHLGSIEDQPVWTSTADFDIDSDRKSDVVIRHGYEGQAFGLSRSAVDLLERGEEGLEATLATLGDIRELVLQSSLEDVDHVALQQQLGVQIDVLDRISRDTSYGGNISFEHLPGRYPFSTSSGLTVARASQETQVGIHKVIVSTTARRAYVEAGTAQTTILSRDETLFVNQIPIDLFSNMSPSQVVTRINSFSDQTGAFAYTTDSWATGIATNDFGTSARLEVFSNVWGSSDSSGFGHTIQSASGVDGVVDIDDWSFTGQGQDVLVTGGPASGLSFRVNALKADSIETPRGYLGDVEVIENPLDPRIQLPNTVPQSVDSPLLDGSAGRTVFAQSSEVRPMRSSHNTEVGSYFIEIITAGERAAVVASVSQSGGLTHDETLAVNGVNIQLPAGSTQAEVIDMINDATPRSGVIADTGDTGATRLYAEQFGSKHTIQVSSSVAASQTSSGFGLVEVSASGVDVVASVDGNTYSGEGLQVSATHGSEKGLTFSFLPSSFAPTRTSLPGIVGALHVIDQSLQFPLDANGDVFRIGLPDVSPDAFGLDSIRLRTDEDVTDALAVVDNAIREITSDHSQLVATLSATPRPAGIAEIASDAGTRFVSEDGYIIRLNENDVIGPESVFDEIGIIDGSGLYPNSWEDGEGYLGFAVPDTGGYRFGWMRIEVGENAAMVVKDYAIESLPGVPIWIGGTQRFVPLLGDFDGNGTVGFSDFLQFSDVFGSETAFVGNQSPDFDGSGRVDFVDFLRLSAAFGASSQVKQVPEPSRTGLPYAICALWIFMRVSSERRTPLRKVGCDG